LVLVTDVGVVACCGELGGAALGTIEVIRTEVDIVKLDGTFDMSSNGLSDSSAIYPALI
jgi:hypothetical protein